MQEWKKQNARELLDCTQKEIDRLSKLPMDRNRSHIITKQIQERLQNAYDLALQHNEDKE